MSHGILTQNEKSQVKTLAVDNQLHQTYVRHILLDGLPEHFESTLPLYPNLPLAQLQSDIRELNKHEELIGLDRPPIVLWLQNAANYVYPKTASRDFERFADLCQRRVSSTTAGQTSAVANWRLHCRLTCVTHIPFFEGPTELDDRFLEHLYVELVVEHQTEETPCTQGVPSQMPLAGLFQLPLQGQPRWLVLGEPGAGKTMMARRLAWRYGQPASELEPVVIYASLARLAQESRHPFEMAEDELIASIGTPAGLGFADELRRLAREPGRIWLLLDTFDEIAPPLVGTMRRRIITWGKTLPNVAIAVFSRPVGCQKLGRDYRTSRVRPLNRAQQHSLLCNWLGEEGANEVERLLGQRPRLADLAPNPLMLTLIAVSFRERANLPFKRAALYERAIDLLLHRGHRQDASDQVVKDPSVAYDLLVAVSLQLHQGDRESWSLPELGVAIAASIRENRDRLFNLNYIWKSYDAFFKDIGRNSGIIGPHDGEREPWRYLHRSLREYLVAVEIARGGPEALIDIVTTIDKDNRGRWSEAVGLALGIIEHGQASLEALGSLARHVDRDFAARVLPDVEVLTEEQGLEFLLNLQLWRPEELLRLVLSWGNPRRAEELLWTKVTPEATTYLLAGVHFVLSAIQRPPDLSRFFEACGRPPIGGPPGVDMLAIPAGQVELDGECPRLVTVGPFEIGSTPVTREHYQCFDPTHACPGGPKHPVTKVSWHEARLFAVWNGCRLPTDAEWEHACRAGTTTRYWSGDSEADLAAVGWYAKNSGGLAHAVAEKPANPFGLYDMHGNVWEWVEDLLDDYPYSPMSSLAPTQGQERVIRGGNYMYSAENAMSSARSGWRPGLQIPLLGFRLARG